MRLIDADKLEVVDISVPDGMDADSFAAGAQAVLELLDKAGTVDAVPIANGLDSSDLIRRKDVLWITKETGALETQSRVRELPAVAAVPLEYHDKCMEAAIKKRILTEQTNRQIIENYAPVVHGEWIKRKKYDMESRLYCSSCKQEYDYIDGIYYLVSGSELPFYCPNCGAKMDGEGDAE